MILLKPSCAHRYRWISGLLLGVLLVLASSTPVVSQTPISARTQIDTQFPASITFSLTAGSSSPITSAVLRYSLDRLSCFEEIVDRNVDFSPARDIQVSWTMNMRKTGGLPSGARIHYRWLIEDEDGNRQETPEETLLFEDSRYQWRSLKQDMVTLYWYEGDDTFISRLMSAAQASLDRLGRDTGAKLERPTALYIYASTTALRQARIFPQAWEGGVAFPDYGLVAIGIAPEQVAWGEKAVAHELAHLLVYQMSFNCYQDLPTWLNEGLATYAQGKPDATERSRLERAITSNQLISVKSLSSSFPADPQQALLSYAESRSLVAFLIQKYSQNMLLETIDWIRKGHTYDEALLQTYGLNTDGLEAAWRQSIGSPPPPPPPTLVPTVAPTPTSTPAATAVPAPAREPAPAPAAPSIASPTPQATPTPTPSGGGLSCARGQAGTPQAPVDFVALLGIGMLLTVGVARGVKSRRGH